jgi:hypothetical protein
MTNLITGMFRDRVEAEHAVADLQSLGYKQNDISVMIQDETIRKKFQDTHPNTRGNKAAEGAGVGAGVGGVLGAIIAGLMATGSIVAIAGTGGAAAPLVAGPLAAALAGLGAGGVSGGIIGALVGAGIPESRARDYEKGLHEGGILVGVYADSSRAVDVRRILKADGAYDINDQDARAPIAGGTLGGVPVQHS